MRKKLIVLSTIILIVAITTLTVYAALPYIFAPSNTDIGTQYPAPTATPEPTASPTPAPTTVYSNLLLTTGNSDKSWTSGQPVTLTVTLDHKLQGVAVDFYESGSFIDTAYTDWNGVASLTYTPPTVTVQTQRVFTAQAHQ